MKLFLKNIPGILVTAAIATVAWFLGKSLPVVGGPVFGILFGMLITAVFPKLVASSGSLKLSDGVKYTSKKLLQLAVILLGFEMNLFNVIKVGQQSLLVIVFTLTASFLMAYWVGKSLKIHSKMAILIGVGTSICGGSAIAATAPVIGAEDEDVAHAISTIFLFNVLAVFIFPALGHLVGLSDTGFGMWAGTAINDTSSVVAAGASWSAAAGNNTALAFATIVKLTRTLMIVPITLVLGIYTARQARLAASSQAGEGTSVQANSFNLLKVFPTFVIWFVVAAVINTFAGLPVELSHGLVTAGKFLIVMAMSAIGLNTNLKRLLTNGIKPILLGLSCWLAVAVVSLIVQNLIGIW